MLYCLYNIYKQYIGYRNNIYYAYISILIKKVNKEKLNKEN